MFSFITFPDPPIGKTLQKCNFFCGKLPASLRAHPQLRQKRTKPRFFHPLFRQQLVGRCSTLRQAAFVLEPDFGFRIPDSRFRIQDFRNILIWTNIQDYPATPLPISKDKLRTAQGAAADQLSPPRQNLFPPSPPAIARKFRHTGCALIRKNIFTFDPEIKSSILFSHIIKNLAK